MCLLVFNPFTARVLDEVLYGDSNFKVCGWNPMMWLFKWKLSSCTYTRCYLFDKILENQIWKFGRNLLFVKFGSERVKGPFYQPKRQSSLPFHIPEAWKRYPFRVEPPCVGPYSDYSWGYIRSEVCEREHQGTFRQSMISRKRPPKIQTENWVGLKELFFRKCL